MLARTARQKRQDRLFAITVGASALLHAALVGVWAWFAFADKPAIDLDQAIVKTKLVKLGKPRDEKLLPRLPTSAPPPPAEKQAPTPDQPAPLKPAEQASDKKPSAAEILSKLKSEQARPDINDLINKRVGEPTDEGQKDGDRLGTELEGSLKAEYGARLVAALQAAQQISATITDEERVRLKARLNLQIDADGNVVKAWVDPSSGNAVYDNDVIAAAKRASPLPAPPLQMRALFAQGVAFNICPVSCK